MNSLDKIITGLGFVLIIIAVVFIFTDVQLLVAYWDKLSSKDSIKIMIGSGIPPKDVLLFDTYRWSLLLIGGFGFVSNKLLGWIFSLAFLLLTFCGLTTVFVSDFCHYGTISWIYLRSVIIISSIIIFIFNVFNLKIMQEYLSITKYQKIWLWSGIFILNVIGMLIYNI